MRNQGKCDFGPNSVVQKLYIYNAVGFALPVLGSDVTFCVCTVAVVVLVWGDLTKGCVVVIVSVTVCCDVVKSVGEKLHINYWKRRF